MAQKRFSLRFLFWRPQQVTIFRVTRSTICICNLLVFLLFFYLVVFAGNVSYCLKLGHSAQLLLQLLPLNIPPKGWGSCCAVTCHHLFRHVSINTWTRSLHLVSLPAHRELCGHSWAGHLTAFVCCFFFFLHRRLSSRAPIWHWSTWAKSMASKVVPSSTCPPWQVTYCKNPSKYNVFRIFAQSVKGILHLKNKNQNDTLETQF